MDGLNPTAEGILPGARPNTTDLTRLERRIVLAMLLGLLGFTALLEPSDADFGGPEWIEWSAIYMSYLLLALPGLLAVWAALSREPLAVRLPRALGLAAVLGLLEVWESTSTPPTVDLAIATMQIASSPILVLVLTALLTIFRRRYGWRIGPRSETAAPSTQRRQFSLKQLLSWIACTAVVLGLARWMTLDSSGEQSSWTDALAILPFLAVLPLFCLPLVIPCVGFCLSDTGRRRFAVWTVVMLAIVAGLLFAAVFAMHYMSEGPISAAEIGSFTLLVAMEAGFFVMGFFIPLLAVLAAFRLCGYRLTRGKTASAPTVAPTTVPCEPLPEAALAQPRRRSPFPRLVGTIVLLALALCWPAWRIHLGREQARADEAAMQQFSELGVQTYIRRGQLSTIAFLPNKPVDEAALRKLSEFSERANFDYLDLSDRAMTDEQIRYLGGLTCVQNLNLAGTGISDAGLAHLAKLKQLQVLYLSRDPITDESMKILREFTNLQALSLAGTQVTDAGVAQLQGLKQLRALSLSDTKITDEALNVLQQYKSLTRLDLCGTRITDAAIEPLKTMKQLQDLSLANTQITDRGRSELARALPQWKVIVNTSEAMQATASPSPSPPAKR